METIKAAAIIFCGEGETGKQKCFLAGATCKETDEYYRKKYAGNMIDEQQEAEHKICEGCEWFFEKPCNYCGEQKTNFKPKQQ